MWEYQRMTIVNVTMFKVVCSGGCGACAQDHGEYAAWADTDAAEAETEQNGWLIQDGEHYCEDCRDKITDKPRHQWRPYNGSLPRGERICGICALVDDGTSTPQALAEFPCDPGSMSG